jgi:hypothetical protein
LVERLQYDENAGQSVQALTADEVELLESPGPGTYKPWVVPLTARSNNAVEAVTDETDREPA